VLLKLTEEPNAIAIPSKAIQTGQKGQFVYVVKPDNTVDLRPVKVVNTVGDESAISSGVEAGEKVVIDGQFALSPNAKVEVKEPQTQGGVKKEKSDKEGKEQPNSEKPEKK
jgi:multidrug efflux system membrane fusion protein